MTKTVTPTFPTPVQLGTLDAGDGFLWWDHNFPAAGIFAYVKGAETSVVIRLADGATQTLSPEVLVVPHAVSLEVE